MNVLRPGWRPLFVVVSLILLSACESTVRGSGAGSATQEVPSASVHPEARQAISELRSPYCPGLMLEVCPSPDAAVLRDSIDALARSGVEADSIVARVIADYGEEWRAVPRRQGWGWWAWLMPPAALLLGLAVVALVLRRRRRAAPERPAPGPLGQEDQDRLRQAMDDLDASEHPDW